MIVSNWYTDELGNQARIIRAHDWELQRNTTGAFVFETERGVRSQRMPSTAS